jgi:hypothetical protein
MRSTVYVLFAAAILAYSFDPHSLEAAHYEFVNVYDTTMVAPDGYTFTGRYEPSINNGTAAFLGYYQGYNRHSIFLGDGETLSPRVSDTDADPSSPFVALENPDLDQGNVAFVAYQQFRTQQGVYKATGATITPIAETGDPAPVGTFRIFDYPSNASDIRFPHVSISNQTVAFRGVYSSGVGIFTGSGGPLTTIVKTDDPAPQYTFQDFGDPAIDGKNVAFVASYPRANQGVFVGDGQSITTIAKTGDLVPSGILRNFGDPTISGDTVAFIAEYDDRLQGIFTGSGGPLTTIVKEGDPAPTGTFNFPDGLKPSPPAIAGDTVAFSAYFGNSTYQHQGVFTNTNGVNTLVVEGGDVLFGSTITYLFLGKSGLDADGTVAFNYVLEDHRQGIAFARLVPEPASGILLVSALLICEAYASSSRKSPRTQTGETAEARS